MSPDLDPKRQSGVPATPGQAAPEGKQPSGALSADVPSAPKQDVGAPPPPPPGTDAPAPQNGPGEPTRQRESLTTAQLETIKDIKSDPAARDAWYKALDAAVQSGEIKVSAAVKTLKTSPEDLSKGAASVLISFAPMRDPEGPATPNQLERVRGAHNHAINSEALANRFESEMPKAWEKVQAGAPLTKEEASNFISLEKSYNQEVEKRPATANQLATAKQMLADDPDLSARMSAQWHGYLDEGKLNHGGFQMLIEQSRGLVKERNQAELDAVLPTLQTLPPEGLDAVAKAFTPALESAVGKTFEQKAQQYHRDMIGFLANPEAPVEKVNKATDFALQFNNARVLREVVDAYQGANA